MAASIKTISAAVIRITHYRHEGGAEIPNSIMPLTSRSTAKVPECYITNICFGNKFAATPKMTRKLPPMVLGVDLLKATEGWRDGKTPTCLWNHE
jgi:hypothetical protein